MAILPGYAAGGGGITEVPGTAPDVVGQALVGFAKGFAERAAEERKQKAANERTLMQSLIQQEMIAPAGEGSKPDFKALGMGWKVDDTISGSKRALDIANTQSLIANRRIDAMKDTDPEAWILDQLNSWDYRQHPSVKLDDAYPEMLQRKEQELRDKAYSGDISYLNVQSVDTAKTSAAGPNTGGLSSFSLKLTEPKQIRDPNKGPITVYRVRDRKSGKEGWVPAEELDTNPNYVRV